MKRLITDNLIEWKGKINRKPLIIRGARQVGKTFSVNYLGENHFRNFVKIDFEKQISAREIFDGDLSPKRILNLIELETGIDIIAGATLLFFDEIQLCPKALASLRYFYEEMPELHVIAAGSLLEFEMEKISFPVGRVEFMYMYPLTFEEFLINLGEERLNAERPSLFQDKPVEAFIHHRLIEKLKEFFVVGGMPEAVKTYIENESLKAVHEVHDSLINAFIQDMLKHEKNIDNDLIRELLEVIPQQVGSAVKYSGLCRTASHYKVKQALRTLEKALLVTTVRSSSAAGLPLGGNVNKSAFKIVFVDIGLMQFLAGISARDIMQSDDLLATYRGSLCEQFAGQELKASGGSQNNELFYWSRASKSSNAEVDYLLVRDGKIYPMEIKHGPAGRLKSLHQFLLEHPKTVKGLVFNTGNIGMVDKIHFMPIYSKLE